jgi:hypothetical protein
MCKYVAKFRLLEHGLLDAALGVDDLKLRTGLRDEETGEVEMEPPQNFQARVNLFVLLHLGRASGSQRDEYKNALVYQARKDLITEFLKATVLRQCKNKECNA